MEIVASALKHGIREGDMRHALRHYWRHFDTDDLSVTLFIGPSISGEMLEVGVVHDEHGVAIIHAMVTRRKFLGGRGST